MTASTPSPLSKRLSELHSSAATSGRFRSTMRFSWPSENESSQEETRCRTRDAPVMHKASGYGTWKRLQNGKNPCKVRGFSVSRPYKPDSSPREWSGRRIWLNHPVSRRSAIPRKAAKRRARDAPVMHGLCCRCQEHQRHHPHPDLAAYGAGWITKVGWLGSSRTYGWTRFGESGREFHAGAGQLRVVQSSSFRASAEDGGRGVGVRSARRRWSPATPNIVR
jgi:hypothetical protein